MHAGQPHTDPTHDRLALDAAIEQAQKSAREGGIPIGAALVDRSGLIVSVAHNERVQIGDPTAHAEMMCIRKAGRRRDWPELTLATTLSPCSMCTGAAVLFRIPRVVIGERDTFLGREDWLKAEGIEVACFDDQLCRELMLSFITEHPDLWDEDIGK